MCWEITTLFRFGPGTERESCFKVVQTFDSIELLICVQILLSILVRRGDINPPFVYLSL